MNPKECYNILLAQKLIQEFQKRKMEGFYCKTKEDALKKVLHLIPKDSIVFCGSSATLTEIGLHTSLKNGDYNFLDPDNSQNAMEKDKIAHEALGADYYLMSANAISITGELVNIDGYGNRVAALSFGPKNVIVIAGLNKVAPDLDAAILRAKTYAAPITTLFFDEDYSTFDELSKASERIYSQLVITSKSIIKDRIKIILVGECLGF